MWLKNVRYLDYNASAGISGSVRERLIESLKISEDWNANPSSRHRAGQKEAHAFFESSRIIAKSLGASLAPDELTFTSSGTEANQTILRTFARAKFGLVIGAGEHSASFDFVETLQEDYPGVWIRILPLSPTGAYDFNPLPGFFSEAQESGIQCLGLSLFWANNETGVITDLERLRTTLESVALPWRLHLDGAQVWGKQSFDLEKTQAHYVTFSSHKIGAPAGSGVIWSRKGFGFHPLIHGSQSSGLRGGSENLVGIQAMAFAAQDLNPNSFQIKTGEIRDRVESSLLREFPEVVIFGSEVPRVSNTSRIGFRGFNQYENWVELLDLNGFSVSQGSACKAKVVEPSRVLLQMGVSRELALNSIRVSFGPSQAVQDGDDFVQALRQIIDSKRKNLR
jgi:cysteine desulfurase